MNDSGDDRQRSFPPPPSTGYPKFLQRFAKSFEVYWADSTGRRNTSMMEVLMGRPAGWMKELTGRSPMKSPGRRRIGGKSNGSSGARSPRGASRGSRARRGRVAGGRRSLVPTWWRHATIDLVANVGPLPVFHEREEIALLRAQGAGIRQIARQLGGIPRRSRGSCAATLPPEGASSNIGPRLRNGRPSWWPSVQRPPSWSPTRGCGTTCRSGCQVRSAARTGRRLQGPRPRHGRAETSRTAGSPVGDGRGAPSRSRTGSRSISPMMSP